MQEPATDTKLLHALIYVKFVIIACVVNQKFRFPRTTSNSKIF